MMGDHYVRGCCQREENKLSFISIVDRVVIITYIKGRKKYEEISLTSRTIF